MMKKIILMAIASLMTFGAIDANAQKNHKDKFGSELGLTEAQKTQIEKINLQEQKDLMPINNQIREKKAHLNSLRTAEKPNLNEINATVEEIGKLRIERDKIEESNYQEIRKLLTEEQRLKLDSKSGNNGEFGEKIGHFGGHYGREGGHGIGPNAEGHSGKHGNGHHGSNDKCNKCDTKK
ncbi:MAG: periplasmic heavy metal sensor [Bacteroidales bacterium]|nr:periplasmic heavy metal sensor [Bacteroidales bacterium]